MAGYARSIAQLDDKAFEGSLFWPEQILTKRYVQIKQMEEIQVIDDQSRLKI